MKIEISRPYSFCQLGKRDNQEDARFPDEDMPAGCAPVFVVCDGVGGRDKGEVASRLVADTLGEYVASRDLSRGLDSEDLSAALGHVYRRFERNLTPDTREMATTMTLVAFHRRGVLCSHMGDSRIYHVRPGVGILYRSDDHSLVNALVHSGNLTPEEAIDHPRSNVITRSIGYVEPGDERPAATTLQISDVEPGDYFFLCTDGVVNRLGDDELLEILSSSRPDREKMELIASRSRLGSDNNTAFLVGVASVERESFDDFDDAMSSDDSSSSTAPIDRPDFRSQEVTPLGGSQGGKLSRFFKSLFH